MEVTLSIFEIWPKSLNLGEKRLKGFVVVLILDCNSPESAERQQNGNATCNIAIVRISLITVLGNSLKISVHAVLMVGQRGSWRLGGLPLYVFLIIILCIKDNMRS